MPPNMTDTTYFLIKNLINSYQTEVSITNIFIFPYQYAAKPTRQNNSLSEILRPGLFKSLVSERRMMQKVPTLYLHL